MRSNRQQTRRIGRVRYLHGADGVPEVPAGNDRPVQDAQEDEKESEGDAQEMVCSLEPEQDVGVEEGGFMRDRCGMYGGRSGQSCPAGATIGGVGGQCQAIGSSY